MSERLIPQAIEKKEEDLPYWFEYRKDSLIYLDTKLGIEFKDRETAIKAVELIQKKMDEYERIIRKYFVLRGKRYPLKLEKNWNSWWPWYFLDISINDGLMVDTLFIRSEEMRGIIFDKNEGRVENTRQNKQALVDFLNKILRTEN